MKVWMTHIGGRPPRYAKGMLAQLKANPPDLFVCGHSHILLVQKVAAWGFISILARPGLLVSTRCAPC